jgi:hypothetical protein
VLVASKYDELDEKIPLISHLIRHYTKILHSSDMPLTFEEIVESERLVMTFFKWDLMILIPTHFVMSLLANGIVFENEVNATPEVAKKVSDKALSVLELLVKNMNLFINQRASLLGTAIIYTARKEMNMDWTNELETMTRYSENDLIAISEQLDKITK